MTLQTRGRHRIADTRPTNDVLLTTAETRDQAELWRVLYRDLLQELGLTSEHGVCVRQASSGWYQVLLGRHDNQPLRPTAAVFIAASKIGYGR